MIFSLNNRFIVEEYVKEGLRSEVKNGFATIAQKSFLKGLKLLIPSKLSDGTIVPLGSLIYIKEEELHTQPWAQKKFDVPGIEGKCLIVEMNSVQFIESKTKVESAPLTKEEEQALEELRAQDTISEAQKKLGW